MKLLKFYTETCQPCRLMGPIVKQACGQTGLDYEDVHAIDDPRGVAYDVRKVPTLVLVNDEVEVARRDGLVSLQDLVQWIRNNGI